MEDLISLTRAALSSPTIESFETLAFQLLTVSIEASVQAVQYGREHLKTTPPPKPHIKETIGSYTLFRQLPNKHDPTSHNRAEHPYERQLFLLHSPYRKNDILMCYHPEIPEWMDTFPLYELQFPSNHPNLQNLIKGGEGEGYTYSLLDNIDGPCIRDIAAHIHNMTPTQQEILALVLGIQGAKGLQALHELHMNGQHLNAVYRSVNPNNALLSSDGRLCWKNVYTQHFGYPQSHSRGFQFMSPKQIKGEYITQKADIYSLGMLLYELLVVHDTFAGSDIDTLRAIIDRKLPSIFTCRPGIGGLGDIITTCLAFDPDNRFESTSALTTALQRQFEHVTQHMPLEDLWGAEDRSPRSVLKAWMEKTLYLESFLTTLAMRIPVQSATKEVIPYYWDSLTSLYQQLQ